ncbi:MAG: deoxyguanosinetriphosphate triphosphohydrolase [Oscillospiraceae bacterium]|nr:deoxyguanosinetriphosphate triphosphohydrolase [Oscillospiraceae bacterium]
MSIREELQAQEKLRLSPYAALSADTKGRERHSAPCNLRTEYQRDRDKIIHCKSFRRLTNKTQVFLSPEGDHYRTRLTHTLEVCQIARTICRALRLNEDLAEAIALGHDLGHTPFGHAGEEVLAEVCPHGYVHAAQSVRVVEHLENGGRGLNLTWEVRNGIRCHSSGEPAATREGQVVRYADKIAYMNHDIDDAVRAGVLNPTDIPAEMRSQFGETISERITYFVEALVNHSGETIQMDERGQQLYDSLRAFMFAQVYTNPNAKREEGKAKMVVRRLYEYYTGHPHTLPEEYARIASESDHPRAVCDYISGMSDRFCIATFEALFVPKAWGS